MLRYQLSRGLRFNARSVFTGISGANNSGKKISLEQAPRDKQDEKGNSKGSIAGTHANVNEVESSIQERVLFDRVFESMQQKKVGHRIQYPKIDPGIKTSSLGDKNSGQIKDLKISFGNRETGVVGSESMSDLKMMYGTDEGEAAESQVKDGKELPIFDFLDSIELELSQIKKKTLAKSGGKFSRVPLPSLLECSKATSTSVRSGDNIRLDTSKIEAETKYNAELTQVMDPYVQGLMGTLNTDYDVLTYFEGQIGKFISRDKKQDELLRLSSTDLLKRIGAKIVQNTQGGQLQLPEPYTITLPYMIEYLLSDASKLSIPEERKYEIVMFIYEQCKKCPDISMYLYLCNVEFYNMLVNLVWINYSDVNKVRQLVIEMQNNGIQGDLHTVEILDQIISEMRTMNDDIMDETDWESLRRRALTIGVVWSKQTETDLLFLESYFKRLKQFLTTPAVAVSR